MAYEEATESQCEVMKRLDSFVSNFNKTPKERLNLGYLGVRETGLHELFLEFVDNHKIITANISKEEHANSLYFRDNTYDRYEEIYFDTLGRIAQKRLDLTPPPQAQLQQQQQAIPALPALPVQNQQHHIQIPRLNVPSFSGSYEDWPSFRDLFVAAVHSNNTLLPVHKLQYLKSLLIGGAETILKHIATTADNYVVAWAKLEERYDNKRALINNTLRKFFAQRNVDDSAPGIRQLLDNTRECIGALQGQGVDTSTWHSILIFIVSQHLPHASLELWEQSIPRNHLPTIDELLTFLEDRFRNLEFSAAHTTPSPNRTRPKPQTFHTATSNSSVGCRLCQESQHPLRLCPKFISMLPNLRHDYVTKSKLCKNCFAYSHKTQACKSSGTCNICGSKHHSMLHLTNAAPPTNISSPPTNASSPTSSIASSHIISAVNSQQPSTSTASSSFVHAPNSQQPSTSTASSSTRNPQQQSTPFSQSFVSQPANKMENTILATALVSVQAFNGQFHTFRAVLDNASEESFVSKRVVQFIGVKPKATSTLVTGIGQSQAPRPLGEIDFTFSSTHDRSFSMAIGAVVLSSLTHVLPSKSVQVAPELVADIELADPTYGTPSSIDVLLSASVFAALTLPAIRTISVTQTTATVALKTKLGWVLFGDATENNSAENTAEIQRSCFHITSDDGVSSALQAFWKVEEVSAPAMLTPQDERCEQIYAETHTRQPDGRYVVHLPFKQDPPMLGLSRELAVSRFLQVERKLKANPTLREDYAKCINEYLQLGHMHPITPIEQQHDIEREDGTTQSTCASYYLPHHAVIKLDSTTTKLRVVFDASSKTKNGASLNDALLIGPVIQDSLFNLLLRWRTNRIVIKADITKMYRQILVAQHHQPYQRIIWRNNSTDELQDFELRTVTFGTAAAPYLAIKTLQQLSNDESLRFPIGANMLQHDFYVDDLLSGADSVEAAIEKREQVTQILQSGGFEIRKWSSNHEKVTDTLDDNFRELCGDTDSTLKALGILWCPKSDTLSIKVSLEQDAVISKRSLLAEVSRLFDPLGWIAPTIICMKIVLQKLWLAGLTWDEPLPESIRQEWNEFRCQLQAIQQISIPRWVRMAPDTTIELHGFCDASEKAYAAAIYVRVKTAENEWSVHLITSKTRVAPVKQLSIPRLELCASVLLAKLLVSVQAVINAFQVHAWTDSEIVLSWLQGHPSRWTTFVGNRVSEIHQSLDAGAWHHVPTKENPADCASRGITPQQLVNHPLWWHGPAWLAKDEKHWPRMKKQDIAATIIESKRSQVLVATAHQNDTVERILTDCSSIALAARVIARIRRVFTKSVAESPLITVEEITRAEHTMVQYTQQLHFPDEHTHLSNKRTLPKSSKLLSLNPFIDAHGLIRVGGRLDNASIPYSSRHPVILPRNSRLTTLIINEAHASTMHGNVSLMLSYIRANYWIIDARNSIRRHNHNCNTCFRYSNPTLHQLMGQLPKPRVNISHPFSHTGIDYAGPISILLRRSPGRPQTSKGYICLFVCLATKAIHLELVGDMSANTFLAALSRFSARRGLPSDIYSDNGTYFVRAASDINNDMLQVIKNNAAEAAKSIVHRSIQWHFIPPSAPHFGGLWEAGVKSMKYHLKRTIGDKNCTYEEMTTMLCQIEACLNSRPLCPISNDPNDFEILTPGHFLVGRPLHTRTQPSTLEIPSNRLDYWQRIYQATESFWRHWQTDYLARMQQRPKWLSTQVNVEIGELVLLKEDNIAPSQWKVARIIEVHKGADNQVRVVTLKTPTSTLKRPIVKICRLPSQ